MRAKVSAVLKPAKKAGMALGSRGSPLERTAAA